MRKKLLIVSAIVCAVVVVLLVGVLKYGWFSAIDEQMQIEADKITAAGADIVVYGNIDELKWAEFEYRRINSLSLQEITGKNSGGLKGYHLLVLYDYDGKMSLTDEDAEVVKKIVLEKHYDVVFFGAADKTQKFVDCGLIAHRMDEKADAVVFDGYMYQNGFPFIYDEKSQHWVNPEEPDVYYYDPIVTNLGGDRDMKSVWQMIFSTATDAIEST